MQRELPPKQYVHFFPKMVLKALQSQLCYCSWRKENVNVTLNRVFYVDTKIHVLRQLQNPTLRHQRRRLYRAPKRIHEDLLALIAMSKNYIYNHKC